MRVSQMDGVEYTAKFVRPPLRFASRVAHLACCCLITSISPQHTQRKLPPITLSSNDARHAYLEQEWHETNVVDGFGELNVAKVSGAVQLTAPARGAIEAALGGAETQVEQTALFRHAAL